MVEGKRIVSQQNQNFISSLSRFCLCKSDIEKVNSLLDNGTSKAEIYRLVSSGKGKGKSHLSGKYRDGELLNS